LPLTAGREAGSIAASFAVEVLNVAREVAQLAGFIDQTGLFRTLFTVTNKLHFDASLDGPFG
jgi:hypothetical protein